MVEYRAVAFLNFILDYIQNTYSDKDFRIILLGGVMARKFESAFEKRDEIFEMSLNCVTSGKWPSYEVNNDCKMAGAGLTRLIIGLNTKLAHQMQFHMLFKYSDPDMNADYEGAELLYQNFKKTFI